MKRILSMLLPLVFVAAGIVVIILSVKGLNNIKNFDKVEAVVEAIEIVPATDPDSSDTQTVHVVYTYGGKEYHSILQDTSEFYSRDQKITVLCDPDHPDYVSAATQKSMTITIIIGAVCIVVGVIAFGSGLIKGRRY